jgi:uncharacterized protein
MKALLVLLVLMLLAWLLFGSSRRHSLGAKRDGPAAPAPGPAAEDMVACAHCGVHLPASLALRSDGRSYCSVAHREAGPRSS